MQKLSPDLIVICITNLHVCELSSVEVEACPALVTHLDTDEHLHIELVAGRTLAPVAADRVLTGGGAARPPTALVLVLTLARVVVLHVTLRTGAARAAKQLLCTAHRSVVIVIVIYLKAHPLYNGFYVPESQIAMR